MHDTGLRSELQDRELLFVGRFILPNSWVAQSHAMKTLPSRNHIQMIGPDECNAEAELGNY